jgi:hypothetical protein
MVLILLINRPNELLLISNTPLPSYTCEARLLYTLSARDAIP